MILKFATTKKMKSFYDTIKIEPYIISRVETPQSYSSFIIFPQQTYMLRFTLLPPPQPPHVEDLRHLPHRVPHHVHHQKRRQYDPKR